MNRIIAFLAAFLLISGSLQAQKFMTRTGHISFFSHTAIEDIEAHNNQVTSIIDTENGDLVFAVLMKGFQFEKALMQEHFNEKYVESTKFPKATFKGKITNLDEVDFSKDGEYSTKVSGSMTIHGVTQEIESTGTLEVKEGKILATAKLPIEVAAYDIKIPGVVKDNIAKVVEATVDITYEPYNK